jgi:hypothetical protein
MKLKIVPKKTMNAHLFGFKLIPNFFALKKTFSKFFMVCGHINWFCDANIIWNLY